MIPNKVISKYLHYVVSATFLLHLFYSTGCLVRITSDTPTFSPYLSFTIYSSIPISGISAIPDYSAESGTSDIFFIDFPLSPHSHHVTTRSRRLIRHST